MNIKQSQLSKKRQPWRLASANAAELDEIENQEFLEDEELVFGGGAVQVRVGERPTTVAAAAAPSVIMENSERDDGTIKSRPQDDGDSSHKFIIDELTQSDFIIDCSIVDNLTQKIDTEEQMQMVETITALTPNNSGTPTPQNPSTPTTTVLQPSTSSSTIKKTQKPPAARTSRLQRKSSGICKTSATTGKKGATQVESQGAKPAVVEKKVSATKIRT